MDSGPTSGATVGYRCDAKVTQMHGMYTHCITHLRTMSVQACTLQKEFPDDKEFSNNAVCF